MGDPFSESVGETIRSYSAFLQPRHVYRLMRFTADTVKYLSWIVTAKKPQEAKDLICAAINCKTWKIDHAKEAMRKSMGRSDWQRALLVLEVSSAENPLDYTSEYSQMLTALVAKGHHEPAWESVFQSANMYDVRLSEEAVKVLKGLAGKNVDRCQALKSYMERNEITFTSGKGTPRMK